MTMLAKTTFPSFRVNVTCVLLVLVVVEPQTSATATATARISASPTHLSPQHFRTTCFASCLLRGHGRQTGCSAVENPHRKWKRQGQCINNLDRGRLEMSSMEQDDMRRRVSTANADARDNWNDKDKMQRELEELREENARLRQSVEEAQEQNRWTPMKVVLENFETGGTTSLPQDFVEFDTGTVVRTDCGQENSNADDGDDDDDTCPLDEPSVTFGKAFRERAGWLVGLLTLQSVSGLILADNEALLQNHPDIVFFLTMLVGAGGNAGNQASVRVIRGIALGTLREDTQWKFLWREFRMAVGLSLTLALAGTLRALLFATPGPETLAIASSLWLIVGCSIALGALLPLGLQKCGIDPAHSSTTIQVVMDIMGVVLTVMVSHFMLDTPLGQSVVQGILGQGGA